MTPRITLSVIVPVHDGAPHLAECLAAAHPAGHPEAELIVVDDASADGSAAVAASHGARVFTLAPRSGPAAARNHGAQQARGELLFFVDADVVLMGGALTRVARHFREDPGLTAVFGSYDARPRAAGLVSRYRNLLHHFVHQQAGADASTFWAGCGAIRRSVFDALGGFDAHRYPWPSIEDIELGYRLRRAGHRIRLDKALQGTHLKRWTLASVLRTDITRRAIPWARLVLETRHAPDALNLRRDQRASAGLVVAGALSVPLVALDPALGLVPLAALGGVLALNRRLYAFFHRQGGLAFAAAAIALHLLYYLYSAASFAGVWTDLRVRGLARGTGRVLRRLRRTGDPRARDHVNPPGPLHG